MATEQLTISEVLQKLKNKEFTCVDLIDVSFRNIEANKATNAIIASNKNDAITQALELDKDILNQNYRGRLHGIPIIVKDNIHVVGMTNTAGCPAFKDFMPNKNAKIVDRLQTEGAIVIAKANMHELGLGVTSKNEAFGYVHNAFDPNYSAGGSSSGTAVAIAAQMCLAGLGTDTVGSIRVPSSVNSIYGFRPSTGRYSSEGITPCAPSLDTCGPMATSIEDLICLDEIITNEGFKQTEVNLAGLNIGIPSGLCDNLHPDVKRAFENIKELIQTTGCNLVDLDLAELNKTAHVYGLQILYTEPYKSLTEFIKRENVNTNITRLVETISSPDVKAIWEMHILTEVNSDLSIKQYEEIVSSKRRELIASYIKVLNDQNVNAIIFPTIPSVPIKFDDINEPQTFLHFIRNTILGSVCGTPGLSLPSQQYSNDGLPIGIEIDGLPNQDHFVLALAMQLDKIFKKL